MQPRVTNDWSNMMQDSQRGGFRNMNYGQGSGFNDFNIPKPPVGGPGAIGFPSNRGPAQGPVPQPVNSGRANAPSGSKDTVLSVRLEGIPQEPKMDFLDHVIKTFKLRVTNAALKQNRQTNLYYAILNCDHEDAVRNCFQMLNGRSIQFGPSSYNTTVVMPDSMQPSNQPIASAGPGPQGPRGQQFPGVANGQSSRFNGGSGGQRAGGFGGPQSARPPVQQQPFQNTNPPRGRGPPGFTNQDARSLFQTEEQPYQQQQQPPQPPPQQQQWAQGTSTGFRRPPVGGSGGRYGEYESVQRPGNAYERYPETSGGRGGFRGGAGGPPQQQWAGGQSRGAARDDSFVDSRRRNLSSSGDGAGGDFGRRGGGGARGGARGGRGTRDFQQTQQPYDQSGQYPQQGSQRQGELQGSNRGRRGPSESSGAQRPSQSARPPAESGSGFEPQQIEAGGSGRPGRRRQGPSLPVKPAGALAPSTQRPPRPQGAGRQQQQPQPPHKQQDAFRGENADGNEVEAQPNTRSAPRRRNKRRSARDDQAEQADETVGEIKSEDRKTAAAAGETGGRRRRPRSERSTSGVGEDKQGASVQQQPSAGGSGRRERRSRGEREPQAVGSEQRAGGNGNVSGGGSGRRGLGRRRGDFTYAYRRAMGSDRRSRSRPDPSKPKPGEFYLFLSEVPIPAPALPALEPGKESTITPEERKAASDTANAALIEELKAWIAAHGVVCKELRQFSRRHSIFFVMFETAEEAREALPKLQADLTFKEKQLKLEEGGLMTSLDERRKVWLERQAERDRHMIESKNHPYIIFWRVFAPTDSFDARRTVLKQVLESKGIVYRDIVTARNRTKINVTFETVEQAREAFAKLRDEKTPGREEPIDMELTRRFASEQDLENNRVVRERAHPGLRFQEAGAQHAHKEEAVITDEKRAELAAEEEKRRALRKERRSLEDADYNKDREKREALKGAYLVVFNMPCSYGHSYETVRRQEAEKKLQELREKVEAAIRDDLKTGEQTGEAAAATPIGIVELWGFCRRPVAVIAFESLDRASDALAHLSSKKLHFEGFNRPLRFELGSDYEKNKRAFAEGNEAEATANGSKSKVTRLPRRRRGGLGRNRGTREAAGVESDATTAQQSSLTVNPTTSTNATSEAEATDGSKPTAQATSTSAAPAN